ncbi:MAG TPA: ectonucleotide pyrophosphatase/phosphodiesterase [Lysobacter sp.]|jgi:predicted AlkP superfamily pyrophosphatase or phosphodiesterase|nr:ectonucleotide pyrophosphatase/phosphodiesterase [Lysobacter sp.]
MPTIRSLALGALTALAFASCSSLPPDTGEPASVLLVSIDAFRADYLDRGITPNLARIARDGVRAQWMNPSYPSLTFPNHYTLVTGLRPDHHGIVHNTMSDPNLGTFKVTSNAATSESRLWGGEPIWVGAEKAGRRTATMFWPGSEVAIAGVRPTRWLPFDDKKPMNERVDTVLGWLSEPVATRPRLATLYFDALDNTSHDFGPDAPQTQATLREVDAAIGRLLDGLSSRDLDDRVNLVVVSDHGMAAVPAGHTLLVEDLIDPADATRITHGEVLGFAPQPGHERAAEARLLGKHEHYECWRKSEMPARWHYGTHPRIPSIVCQMQVGWDAIPREDLAKRKLGQTRGSHGYDPQSVEMRALFIARGPSFRSGVTLPSFDNVDVYPLLARLVGITPAANDGDIAPLLPALRDSATHRGSSE